MLVDILYKVDHDALYQYLTHFAFPLMLFRYILVFTESLEISMNMNHCGIETHINDISM